jgi:phosphoribosylglycinamide formyltransferase-1
MDERNSAVAKLRIAVLASGSGTTLQAVIDSCLSGVLHGEVVLVISNNSGSGAMARAERHDIPAVHLSGRTHPDPDRLDRAIAETLSAHSPDVVLLAGYMKKLGPHALEAYRGRVINTHPSLLPRHGGRGLYGSRVHAAVLAAGDPVTGVSVHLVDGDYDSGRVLARKDVDVAADDDAASLATRVQAVERLFLVDVLQRIAMGELELENSGRVGAGI